MTNRLVLFGQLALSVAILVLPLSNEAKLCAFPLVWWLTFQPQLNKKEWIFYGFSMVFFTAMDLLLLRRGMFSFTHPDLLGIPMWEPLIWGFLLLHAIRTFAGMPLPPRLGHFPIAASVTFFL